jgi:hypothetical protein
MKCGNLLQLSKVENALNCVSTGCMIIPYTFTSQSSKTCFLHFQVVASTTAAEECITYRYANFRKGGLLIETFNKGGSKEVKY